MWSEQFDILDEAVTGDNPLFLIGELSWVDRSVEVCGRRRRQLQSERGRLIAERSITTHLSQIAGRSSYLLE